MPADFKLLLNVHLAGGNHGFNTVVPNDSRYDKYASVAGAWTLAKSDLINLGTSGFGVNAMPELAKMYNAGHAAFFLNIGNLVMPVTKADLGDLTKLPKELYSHLDQATFQENARSDLPAAGERTGWGGRIIDALASINGVTPYSPAINHQWDANVFLEGNNQSQYAISPYGPVNLAYYGGATTGGGTPEEKASFNSLIDINKQPYVNTLANYVAKDFTNSWNQTKAAFGFLEKVPAFGTFSDTEIAKQLAMAARLVKGGVDGISGFKRQVCFAKHYFYDFHSDSKATQQKVLAELDAALGAFYNAIKSINALANIVVTFTTDFGRTMATNGNGGTDHGWGNCLWAISGACKPGVYGTYPDLTIGGTQDSGDGRYIPTMSLDQYAGEAAKWMGVTDLNSVFPLLKNFPVGVIDYLV